MRENYLETLSSICYIGSEKIIELAINKYHLDSNINSKIRLQNSVIEWLYEMSLSAIPWTKNVGQVTFLTFSRLLKRSLRAKERNLPTMSEAAYLKLVNALIIINAPGFLLDAT